MTRRGACADVSGLVLRSCAHAHGCCGLFLQSKKRVGVSRRMKNPEKLAASKKKPLVARYILGNRVILTRDPTFVPEYAN